VNAWRHDRGEQPIGVGIGLASGACVAGAMGARRRMEFTVIGDAVNLASRLSSLAEAGQVLCDERTYMLAGSPSGAERLPAARVKGKDQPVSVFRVWGS
jgi:adenylate cyclase